MNLYCDNYATCNQMVRDRGSGVLTNFAATLRGWYLYRGESETGKWLNMTLCANCYGKRRRQDPTPELLNGQLEFNFEEGIHEQGTTAPPPEAGRDS